MPYYRGDNYGRGDYYQGDGIFGKIGGFLKGAVSTALSLTPVGQAVKTVGSLVAGAHPSLPQPKGVALAIPSQTGLVNIGGAGVSQTGLFNFGGGPGPGPGPMIGAGAGVLKGYHLNKSTYETRGGGTSRWGSAGNLQIHPKGTVLVRNRRQNPGNVRALKRGLRRATAFARIARRVMTVHRTFKKSKKRK